MIWRINRYAQDRDWTLGTLYAPSSVGLIHFLELGWKENMPDVSRIPEGDYVVGNVFYDRKRIRLVGNGCYESQDDMEGSEDGERFATDIHVANHVTELKGCAAAGLGVTAARLPPLLIDSGLAVARLLEAVKAQEVRALRIEIRDRF